MIDLKQSISQEEWEQLPDKYKYLYHLAWDENNILEDWQELDEDWQEHLEEIEKQEEWEKNHPEPPIKKPLKLKELKQKIPEGLQEVLDIGETPIISNIKHHPLLCYKDKLIYFNGKFEDYINYNSIYLIATLKFFINRNDKVSAIDILQNTIKQIIEEHKKELLFGKEIKKIQQQIDKVFFSKIKIITDYVDEIDYLTQFHLLGINQRVLYKENPDYTFNYKIDLEIWETFEEPRFASFPDIKTYNLFKLNVKRLYNKCQELLKKLLIENQKKTQAITPCLYSQGNPAIKGLYEIIGEDTTKITKITKNQKTYSFGNNKQYSFTMDIEKNFTPSDYKYLLYILSYLKKGINDYTINLKEYMDMKGVVDKKEFCKRCNESLEKLTGNSYIKWQTEDGKEGGRVNLIFQSHYDNRNLTHYITFFPGFYQALSNKYGNLMAIPINKKIMALPDRNPTLNKVALCLNNNSEFRKGKKKKAIHKKKDTAGIFYTLQVKTILSKTNLETTHKKPSKIINEFENIMADLENNYKIIDYWDYCLNSFGDELSQDFYQLSAREKMNLYIKYYKPSEPEI